MRTKLNLGDLMATELDSLGTVIEAIVELDPNPGPGDGRV